MKITQESSSRMVLKDWNLSSFFMGLIFVIIGGAVVFFLPKKDILPLAIGAVFGLAGLYMLATTKIIEIILDKGNGKCTFKIQRLIGSETKAWTLEEIRELRLSKILKRSRKSSRYQHTLVFISKTGEELPFEFGSVSAGIFDVLRDPSEKIRTDARQVSEFLGVSLTEVGPPSVSEAISAIKSTVQDAMEKARKD